MGLWTVRQSDKIWVFEADDQWDAWEQALKGKPEQMTIVVSALECVPGYTEADSFSVQGVSLLLRWGEYELAKKLDLVAQEHGLPSLLGKEAYERIRRLGAKEEEE